MFDTLSPLCLWAFDSHWKCDFQTCGERGKMSGKKVKQEQVCVDKSHFNIKACQLPCPTRKRGIWVKIKGNFDVGNK